MTTPSSVPAAILARAFRARNGELGFHHDDAPAFLAACRRDHVEVLGWELWIIDHAWGANGLVPQMGSWCGGIPVQGQATPVVVSGEGGVEAASEQLAAFDPEATILPEWLPWVRVNFSLDD